MNTWRMIQDIVQNGSFEPNTTGKRTCRGDQRSQTSAVTVTNRYEALSTEDNSEGEKQPRRKKVKPLNDP